MIVLSRIRRLLLLAGLALLSVLAVACGCTAIGCPEGLNVRFGGNLQIGKTYDVELATITTTPEVVPFARCSLQRPGENLSDLRCSSSRAHSESFDRVQIRDQEIKKLRVTVTLEGAQVLQQTFDVQFESKEINGPGCGTCTSASVEVQVP